MGGGRADWTFSPEPGHPLTTRVAAHSAFIIHAAPITEIAQPVLPRLLALLTNSARRQNNKSPHSAATLLAAQGGGEAPAGLLAQFAQHK